MCIAPSVHSTGTSPLSNASPQGAGVSFETSWAPESRKESHIVPGSSHMSAPAVPGPTPFQGAQSTLVSSSHESDAVLWDDHYPIL